MSKTGKMITLGVVFSLIIGMGAFILLRHKEIKDEKASFFTMKQFVFRTADGEPFTNSDLPKGKPIVFMLFNPTCEFCLEEVEGITAIKSEFSDVQFIMVSDADQELTDKFVGMTHLDQEPNFQIVYNHDQAFEESFGMSKIPSTIIYDKNHEFMGHYEGIMVKAKTILYTITGEIEIKDEGPQRTMNLGGEDE